MAKHRSFRLTPLPPEQSGRNVPRRLWWVTMVIKTTAALGAVAALVLTAAVLFITNKNIGITLFYIAIFSVSLVVLLATEYAGVRLAKHLGFYSKQEADEFPVGKYWPNQWHQNTDQQAEKSRS